MWNIKYLWIQKYLYNIIGIIKYKFEPAPEIFNIKKVQKRWTVGFAASSGSKLQSIFLFPFSTTTSPCIGFWKKKFSFLKKLLAHIKNPKTLSAKKKTYLEAKSVQMFDRKKLCSKKKTVTLLEITETLERNKLKTKKKE